MSDSPAPEHSDNSAVSPTRRKSRPFIYVLVTLAVLLISVVLVLPSVLGSKWLYQPVLERLAKQGLIVEIERLELGWLTPLRVQNIQVQMADGKSVLAIRQWSSSRTLWGFLLHGRDLGEFVIDEPTVDVDFLESGHFLDLVRGVVGAESDAVSSKSRPKIDIDFVVRNASAIVQKGNDKPLFIVPPFDVDISYLGRNNSPLLDIGMTQLLKEVELTRELVDLGLGHAVPWLFQATWFDGRVSLTTDGFTIPLDAPEKARGKASLTFHQARCGPADENIRKLLDLIAQLRRRDAKHELVFMQDSVIDIEMKEGRIFHQGLEFGIPRIDERLQIASEGSVGILDRSLDQLISFPVPVEQLAARDQVKRLGVPMVRLPIRGQLGKAEVDWGELRQSSADLIGMIREQVEMEAPGLAGALGAIEGVTSGKADDAILSAVNLIQEIQRRRSANREAAENNEGASSEKRPPVRPIRDRLRKLLDGPRSDEQDQKE